MSGFFQVSLSFERWRWTSKYGLEVVALKKYRERNMIWFWSKQTTALSKLWVV